jgi:hypothetical protein
MSVNTIEELKIKMRAIMGKWHKGTRQGNHGDAGNTLEGLLGVPENNFKLPDFGEIEIKTKKFEGRTSLLTLFHREPQPAKSIPSLLKCMGWKHEQAGDNYPADEMSFRSTTYGHRFSDRGLKIVPDEKNGKLLFVFDPTQVNRKVVDRTAQFADYGAWADDIELRATSHYKNVFPIWYDLRDVEKAFIDKLSHTLLAFYKSKTENSIKFYQYNEAFLMKDVITSEIVRMITDGAMAIDFDARTRHNHGTKFRVKRSEIHRLFTQYAAMET